MTDAEFARETFGYLWTKLLGRDGEPKLSRSRNSVDDVVYSLRLEELDDGRRPTLKMTFTPIGTELSVASAGWWPIEADADRSFIEAAIQLNKMFGVFLVMGEAVKEFRAAIKRTHKAAKSRLTISEPVHGIGRDDAQNRYALAYTLSYWYGDKKTIYKRKVTAMVYALKSQLTPRYLVVDDGWLEKDVPRVVTYDGFNYRLAAQAFSEAVASHL